VDNHSVLDEPAPFILKAEVSFAGNRKVELGPWVSQWELQALKRVMTRGLKGQLCKGTRHGKGELDDAFIKATGKRSSDMFLDRAFFSSFKVRLGGYSGKSHLP
jgi:hypothetical protein